MIEMMTNIFFDFSANALNTAEKLKAFSRFHGERTGMADPRFFLAGVIMIGVLVVILVLYRKNRNWKEEDVSKSLFESNIERLGLDGSERQLVLEIAKYSKLRKIDSIFSASRSFDQGAAVAMKKSFSQGKTLVERKHLNHEITSLKEKLGFKEESISYTANEYSFKPKGLSSRQVPIGRNVLMSRIHSKDASPLTAVVTGNTDYELKLTADEDFCGKPGEIWRVHYQLGAVIWKFDSLVVSSEGKEVILSHTENIRFINRRKFVHAPVKLHGYIARFHCARTVKDVQLDLMPQFVSAKITEISGPTIKIVAPMEVRTGERVLVIFELSANRIIQSTAEVRRSENDETGYIIVAEMIDINEACINELITATNNAVIGLAREEDVLQKELKDKSKKQDKKLAMSRTVTRK